MVTRGPVALVCALALGATAGCGIVLGLDGYGNAPDAEAGAPGAGPSGATDGAGASPPVDGTAGDAPGSDAGGDAAGAGEDAATDAGSGA